MTEGLFLKNWELAVISDTLHDLELNQPLSEDEQEVLNTIDEYILDTEEVIFRIVRKRFC